MSTAAGKPAIYWAASIGALAILIVEIFTSFTTLGTIALLALVAVSVFARPGGLMRRR